MNRNHVRWHIVWPWAKRVWNGDRARRQSPRVGVWVSVAVLATAISLLILVQSVLAAIVEQSRLAHEKAVAHMETSSMQVRFLRAERFLRDTDPEREALDAFIVRRAKAHGIDVEVARVEPWASIGLLMTPRQAEVFARAEAFSSLRGMDWKTSLVSKLDPQREAILRENYQDHPAYQTGLPVLYVGEADWQLWGRPETMVAWRGVLRFSPFGKAMPATKRFALIPVGSALRGNEVGAQAQKVLWVDERGWRLWHALGRGSWFEKAPLGDGEVFDIGDWFHRWRGNTQAMDTLQQEVRDWLQATYPSLRLVVEGPFVLEKFRTQIFADSMKTLEKNLAFVEQMRRFLLGVLALVIAAQAAWSLRWLCRQRQADIAVLKTLGWSTREVSMAFVLVALALGAAGALCGWVLGAGWVGVGNFVIDHWGAQLGLLDLDLAQPGAQEVGWVAMSIGWVALVAVWPAWRAARQNPALLLANQE